MINYSSLTQIHIFVLDLHHVHF